MSQPKGHPQCKSHTWHVNSNLWHEVHRDAFEDPIIIDISLGHPSTSRPVLALSHQHSHIKTFQAPVAKLTSNRDHIKKVDPSLKFPNLDFIDHHGLTAAQGPSYPVNPTGDPWLNSIIGHTINSFCHVFFHMPCLAPWHRYLSWFPQLTLPGTTGMYVPSSWCIDYCFLNDHSAPVLCRPTSRTQEYPSIFTRTRVWTSSGLHVLCLHFPVEVRTSSPSEPRCIPRPLAYICRHTWSWPCIPWEWAMYLIIPPMYVCI